jgi:hypothetical protein
MARVIFKKPTVELPNIDLVKLTYPYIFVNLQNIKQKKIIILVTESVSPFPISQISMDLHTEQFQSIMFKYVEKKLCESKDLNDEETITFSMSHSNSYIDLEICETDLNIEGIEIEF